MALGLRELQQFVSSFICILKPGNLALVSIQPEMARENKSAHWVTKE